MRLFPVALLLSFAAACDSEHITPSTGAEGGSSGAGEAGASSDAGTSSVSGGSGSNEGGAGGEPGSGLSFHFQGSADEMVEPMGGEGGGAGEGSGGIGGMGGAGVGGAGIDVDAPVTRVECAFYGDMIDVVPTEDGGFSGIVIGEVLRRLWSGENPLVEFQAVIGGPGDFTTDDSGNIELHLVGDQPSDAIPFWLELETLNGTEESSDHYEGAWTCASLMIDEPGFRDVGPDGQGTWELAPLE